MPFDGSGGFNRIRNWVNDATAGIKIKADLHDSEDNNLAAGLSNCLTKDGQTQPTANIPMNGKKLINLAAPTNPTDAATKAYADSVRSFATGISLTGPVPEARISFVEADIGFGARVAGTPSGALNRFVWNDKADLSGADVAVMDDTGKMALGGATIPVGSTSSLTVSGTISAPAFISNSYYSTAWKAIEAGFGSYIHFDKTLGVLTIATASATVAVGADLAMANRLSFDPTKGPTFHDDKISYSNPGTQWHQHLTPTVIQWRKAGGNYQWYRSDDGLGSGANQTSLMGLSDDGTLTTVNVSAAGNVTAGTVTGTGSVRSGISFVSTTANAVLATTGAGIVYLRGNGEASTTGQVYVEASGNLNLTPPARLFGGGGYVNRNGINGAFSGSVFNIFYNAGPCTLWIDNTNLGNISVSSDYRIKKGVTDLASTWETVKALRPISYTQAEFTPPSGMELSKETGQAMFPSDDVERWGFIAHELQETLVPAAANGVKDAPDEIQSLNLPVLVAALTKALQEAMARIEALEAA